MASTVDRSTPSTIAIVVATAIVSVLSGFILGQASAIGVFSGSKRAIGDRRPVEMQDTEDSDDSEEDEDRLQQEGLADFSGDNEDCKLVLVVRTDLGMTKGKIAAQCSHATLACYKTLLQASFNDTAQSHILKLWEGRGQAKVAVQVKSEDELELLQAQAISLGICARVIHDQGRTQIAAGSATVLGVGPAPKKRVDEVTGHLKLL